MKAHDLDLDDDQFQLFQEGNEKVFKLVFDRYHKILFRYTYAALNDVYKSEDIVQTAFIQLFKNKTRISSPDALYPYIFVITKRLVAKAFKEHILNLSEQLQNKQMDMTCEETEQELKSRDLKSILNQLIDQLPQKQREIYRLSKLQGYSYDEISSITGSSRNTVKNQLITASKKIKSNLEKLYLIIFYFFFM